MYLDCLTPRSIRYSAILGTSRFDGGFRTEQKQKTRWYLIPTVLALMIASGSVGYIFGSSSHSDHDSGLLGMTSPVLQVLICS